MDNKPWYKSKAVIAGIIAILLAVYNTVLEMLLVGCSSVPAGLCIHLPPIPEWIYGVLGMIGVYGRAVAKTRISIK